MITAHIGADKLPPWVQIVVNALAQAETRRRRRYEYMRVGLPYCLHGMADPSGARCVVNRDYRTVGTSEGWSNYQASTGWHVSREHFERLRGAGVVTDGGYFFSDREAPWHSAANRKAYQQKIAKLLEPWVKAKP